MIEDLSRSLMEVDRRRCFRLLLELWQWYSTSGTAQRMSTHLGLHCLPRLTEVGFQKSRVLLARFLLCSVPVKRTQGFPLQLFQLVHWTSCW